MKILIGSQNPVKIDAVAEAFNHFFDNVQVIGINVKSGVPDQPVNDDTYKGAENRAQSLYAMDNSENSGADFFVGIEGGIMKIYGAWFGFGCMCIIDKSGRKSFGTSPHFELPDILVSEMLKGKELGLLMDESTGEKNTKQNQGAIGIFTKGVMNRKDLYASGLITALVPFLNADLFSKKNIF